MGRGQNQTAGTLTTHLRTFDDERDPYVAAAAMVETLMGDDEEQINAILFQLKTEIAVGDLTHALYVYGAMPPIGAVGVHERKGVQGFFGALSDVLTYQSAPRTKKLWLYNPGARLMLNALAILPAYDRAIVLDSSGIAHSWAQAPDDREITRIADAPKDAAGNAGTTLCGLTVSEQSFQRAQAGTWERGENVCAPCRQLDGREVDRPEHFELPLGDEQMRQLTPRATGLLRHVLAEMCSEPEGVSASEVWQLGADADDVAFTGLLTEAAHRDPGKVLHRLHPDAGRWIAEQAQRLGVSEQAAVAAIRRRSWMALFEASRTCQTEDELWARAQALLAPQPPRRRRRKPGMAERTLSFQRLLVRDQLQRLTELHQARQRENRRMRAPAPAQRSDAGQHSPQPAHQG